MIMYRAAALQLVVYPINYAKSKVDARQFIADAITRIDSAIYGLGIASGGAAKLIVLPEYILTNFPMGMSYEKWADWAALEVDGKEYTSIATIAQKHKCYLCINAYERDEHFDDTYFQSCVIFGPSGDTVLRYRRLNSLHTPTPHDYWDRYLELYGRDGIFPVAKTEIGNLCAVASEEIQYPELLRTFSLRGAEVICHPSAESLDLAVSAKDIAKRARAIETLSFVVSANVAGHKDVPFLEGSADGLSKIVDYEGRVLAEAGQGESITASTYINISALRRFRNHPTLDNFLSRQRFELYRETYSSGDQYPANSLVNRKPSRELFIKNQNAVLERLRANGVIEDDEGMG